MGESLSNLLWGSRLKEEKSMKSGANFADKNRIRRMALGEDLNAETGQPFSAEQISALLQIQLDVVKGWVDYFQKEDMTVELYEDDLPEEDDEA